MLLDGAAVKGSACLNPVTVTGCVRALGATIGGELTLQMRRSSRTAPVTVTGLKP
jgi:hypothetical protein